MTVTQVWCPDSELYPWLPLCPIGMLGRLGGGLLRQRNSQHQRPINMAVYSRKMNQAAAYQKGKVQVSCLRHKYWILWHTLRRQSSLFVFQFLADFSIARKKTLKLSFCKPTNGLRQSYALFLFRNFYYFL